MAKGGKICSSTAECSHRWRRKWVPQHKCLIGNKPVPNTARVLEIRRAFQTSWCSTWNLPSTPSFAGRGGSQDLLYALDQPPFLFSSLSTTQHCSPSSAISSTFMNQVPCPEDPVLHSCTDPSISPALECSGITLKSLMHHRSIFLLHWTLSI